MAVLVVLTSQGIEPNSNKFQFLIEGDPSVLGLKAAVGSVAIQIDSAPPLAQWQKLSAPDNGWSLIAGGGGSDTSSSGSYRASKYAVPVDGSADSTATFTTLVGTTMPQTGGPYPVIIGPLETLKFANDYTIPANVRIQSTGGLIKPASGKTVTLLQEPTSVGPLLDASLGGTLAAGIPMTIRPSWFGHDATGSTDNSAHRDRMLAAGVAQVGGGCFDWPAGSFAYQGNSAVFSNNFGLFTFRGVGHATQMKSFANYNNASGDWHGMFSIYGGAGSRAQKVAFKDMRFTANGVNDCTTPIIMDDCEDMTLENIWWENFGIECIRGLSGTDVYKFTAHNVHAKNCGTVRGAGVINVGAESTTITDSTFEGCSVSSETAARWTIFSHNRVLNSTQWGAMIFSTWSGYLDPFNSFTQKNGYGATISTNQFSSVPDRAILLPDYTGHTNPDGAHPIPAHLDGNLGQIIIAHNLFDRVGYCVWGGADKLGAVDFNNNLCSGQFDAGTGPQSFAIAPMGGAWNVHDNTFQIGQGIQWSGLIGYAYANRNAGHTVFANNTVINKCWSSAPMITAYQDDTISGTRFVDLDGTLSGSTFSHYQIKDPWNTIICELKNSEYAWQDRNHQICAANEPSIIPVTSAALPAKFSFKPGDVLVNRGNNAAITWFNKKCTVGGTVNPTAPSCTASGTSGTKTITVSDSTNLMQYGWIYFPAIPAIAPKKIMVGFQPGVSTVLTIDANLEATVTAGTAVAWAVPQFVTDRDVNSLTVASQAAGDTIYATSASAWARLAKGADGAEYSLVGGVPTWVTAWPRAANVNSSTAATVTWSPQFNEQQITMTAATPAITIAAIPSGGYLVLACTQDATGGRLPTFTTALTGGLVWSGGSANTTWSAATKTDIVIFHNVGTRVEVWLGPQNI